MAEENARRKFLKYGIFGLATLTVVGAPFKFRSESTFLLKDGKIDSPIQEATASAMCGIGGGCAGGGGQCGIGGGCGGSGRPGGGGQCGIGGGCSGGGGQCGIGGGCAGS